MVKRAATEIIKGYDYQFNLTITMILDSLLVEENITVEGVEDIDFADHTALQCKYYEGSEYNHSIIKEAIQLFLRDFAQRKKIGQKLINYKLYGHYKTGCSKLDDITLNTEFYKKNFFTKASRKLENPHFLHDELKLTDSEILEFISKVSIEINGLSFTELEKKLIDQFLNHFNCSNDEAFYYYCNGIQIIHELARNSSIENRKITKKEFLLKLENSHDKLFTATFFTKKGDNQYVKYIRRKILNSKSENFFRIFSIDCELENQPEMVDLLITLINEWSNRKKNSRNFIAEDMFCPVVLLHNFSPSNILSEVKQDLIQKNYLIEDGHYFKDSKFNTELFIRTPTKNECSYRVKLKILNTKKDLDTLLSLPSDRYSKHVIIYDFYKKNPLILENNKHPVHQIFFKKLTNIKDMVS